MKIAVLCAHKHSNYFKMPDIEVYDEIRDCRTFPGGMPVICHPPCAQWSRMKAFSNNNPDQKGLAQFCLDHITNEGGIFEHPAGSDVFKELEFPKEGKIYSVDQSWWGFPARKRTYLYFYRCKPIQFPISLDMPQFVVATSRRKGGSLPEMKKKERALTPLSFNQWLVDCIRETHK